MKLFFSSIVTIISVAAPNAYAINPASWSDYDTESLSVVVTIPIPEKPETVTLKPLLIKPSTPSPWKSIVMPSNCTGADDELWKHWVPELIKSNIAVVLLDSFTPRGFSNICSTQSQPFGIRLQDSHQVLDALRRDERFVKNKIAIGGHSTGAITSLLSAYEEALTHLNRNADGRFNAFIAAAASCEMTYKNRKLLGPLLLINGEKDDYTLPGPCKNETERLKSVNEPAEIIIIKDAYHSFSVSGVYNAKVMKVPAGFPPCYIKELSYRPRETLLELETGEVLKMDKLVMRHMGFLGNKLYGATTGGNWDKAPEVAKLTVSFLKMHGW